MTSRGLRRVCDLRKLGRLANMRQLDDALGVGSAVPETDAVALPRRLCDLSDNGGPDESYPSMDSSSLPVLRFNCRFCRKTARGHGGQFLSWVQRSLVWAELRQQLASNPSVFCLTSSLPSTRISWTRCLPEWQAGGAKIVRIWVFPALQGIELGLRSNPLLNQAPNTAYIGLNSQI